jgi:hypothetical protein
VHVYDGDRRQVDPARAFVTPAAGNLPDWLWQHLVSFLLRGKVRGMIADRGHAARSD